MVAPDFSFYGWHLLLLIGGPIVLLLLGWVLLEYLDRRHHPEWHQQTRTRRGFEVMPTTGEAPTRKDDAETDA